MLKMLGLWVNYVVAQEALLYCKPQLHLTLVAARALSQCRPTYQGFEFRSRLATRMEYFGTGVYWCVYYIFHNLINQ